MGDLWAFLIQTLTASGAAVFLLTIKALFQDKLSPRWQFSVWGILGLVLLIPAGAFGRHILVNWSLWIETVKSCFFGIFTQSSVCMPIPLFPVKKPTSPADWIFIGYLAGVAFFALRYLGSYIRLRRILSRGVDVSQLPELAEVQKQYGLPSCRAVEVQGISSAFVCGILHPVLAIPADRETDRKVLLHELLHLKNRDVIWGVVISAFRCIHWCNPLLWYCANRAMNDMEALCDQRVLEHLEGEERRTYGKILLSMANEKYARTPGTSSAANGGKNIRKRIEAIARFKRYPTGMGLVSVCILVTLISPLLVGTKTEATAWETSNAHRVFSQVRALNAARMTPCTTFAGAIDTYAKSILTGKQSYRMMCLREDMQQQMLKDCVQSGTGFSKDSLTPEPMNPDKGYWVYHVVPVSEDRLEALLIFQPVKTAVETGKLRLCTQKVALCRKDSRWYAEAIGGFEMQEVTDQMSLLYGCRELPTICYRAETEDFVIMVELQQIYQTENWSTPEASFPQFTAPEPIFNLIPDPDMEFSLIYNTYWAEASYQGAPEHKEDLSQIGLSLAPWDPSRPRPELPFAGQPDSTGSDSDGEWTSITLLPGWENSIHLGGGGNSEAFWAHGPFSPEQFAADLYLNGEKSAELTLIRQEETP